MVEGMNETMRFSTESRDNIFGICIHLELIMYGDVFLDIKNLLDEGTKISWLSLCDGGDIADEGEKIYPPACFAEIADNLYSSDFPETEDNEMYVSWEILCFDQNNEQIDGTTFGTWNRELLCRIIQDIQDIIKDDVPLACLIDTLDA